MRNVFLFNPTCEMAIANNTASYMPPVYLRRFELDIAPLMGFAGTTHDYLISGNQKVVSDFYDSRREIGFDLPMVQGLENVKLWNMGEIDLLAPWGWSRAAHRILAPLKQFCGDVFITSPVSQWKSGNRDFYSRRTSVLFLQKYREKAIALDYVSIPYTPVIMNSFEQIQEWTVTNKPPFVFKAPWSSSGRGLYPVFSKKFVKRSEVWVKSRLKQQNELIVEPWLNKAQDFSFQFYIRSNGEIDFLGVNYFEAGVEGNFKGEYIGFPQTIEHENILKSLPDNWVSEVEKLLLETMREQRFVKYYCGPVGIDGIIFRDEANNIKVHPCIEINFRYNMGLLNLEIRKKIHADAVGVWRIKQFKSGEWHEFVKQNNNKFPLSLANGKVISGFLPLVPDVKNQLYGAWAMLV